MCEINHAVQVETSSKIRRKSETDSRRSSVSITRHSSVSSIGIIHDAPAPVHASTPVFYRRMFREQISSCDIDAINIESVKPLTVKPLSQSAVDISLAESKMSENSYPHNTSISSSKKLPLSVSKLNLSSDKLINPLNFSFSACSRQRNNSQPAERSPLLPSHSFASDNENLPSETSALLTPGESDSHIPSTNGFNGPPYPANVIVHHPDIDPPECNEVRLYHDALTSISMFTGAHLASEEDMRL